MLIMKFSRVFVYDRKGVKLGQVLILNVNFVN